ncbi:MAG: hypothetical protein WC856_02315 [Methylococcaceae bacterium]|jgi:hypothetical protein
MAMLSSDAQGFITGTTITEIKRVGDTLSLIRSDVLAIKNSIIGSNRIASQQNNSTVVPFPAQRDRQSVVVVVPTRGTSDTTRNSTGIPSDRPRDALGRYASNQAAATPGSNNSINVNHSAESISALVDNAIQDSSLNTVLPSAAPVSVNTANTAVLSQNPVNAIVVPRNQHVSTPTRARGSNGRFSANEVVPGADLAYNAAPTNTINATESPLNSAIATPRTQRAVTPNRPARDNSGRFVAGSNATTRTNQENATRDGRGLFTYNDEGDRNTETNILNRLATNITEAVSVTATGLEDVDPTVKATQEIAQVATPLLRGFQVLTGSDKNKGDSRWFRKILNILTLTRSENTTFNRATRRTLGDIQDNTEGVSSSGGDGNSGFIGFLSGVLLRYIAPILAGVAIAGVAAWALFTDQGKEFLHSVGEKITSAWDIVVQDLKLTFSAIGDKITGAWDGAIDSFIKTFPTLSEWLKSAKTFMTKDVVTPTIQAAKTGSKKAIASVEKAGNTANDYIQSKTGLDVKKAATTDIVTPTIKWAKKGIGSIGDLIRGGESGKENYNAYNRGTGLGSNGHRDLTNMTLGEIQAAQALPKSDKGRLMAVGKYQMMPSTLKEGMAALKIGADEKFDEATQEKLFSEYLLGKKRPKIRDYITGKSDDAQAAQIAGAQEWRSIADPRTGKTYADGGASGNKASITSDDWLKSMDMARNLYQENINLGLTQKEAYSKAVSGMEKIVSEPISAIQKTIETYQTVQAPAIKSAPSFPSPQMPKAAIISDMVPVPNPMNSDSDRQNISVTVDRGDVSRDFSDRRLANIVTGGLSGG